MKFSPPTVLVICEGFGYTIETHNNALAQAGTPFLDALCEQYPTTLLKAHGNALGYPDYYGSSPYAGFWTLMSGEKNNTQLAQLDTEIQTGNFFEHKILQKLLTNLAKNKRRFHIIITLSYTAPEHRIEHILALIHTALFHEVKEIMLHIVLTESNVFDMATILLLEKLESLIASTPHVTLASIQGKSFTQSNTADEATLKQSYSMLTEPSTPAFASWKDLLSHYYVQGIHDSFIPPTALYEDCYIQPKDGVLFATYSKNECLVLQEYMIKKTPPAHNLLSLFDYDLPGITPLYQKKNYKDYFSLLMKNKHTSILTLIDYHQKNSLYFYAQDNFKNFSQQFTVRSVIQSAQTSSGKLHSITDAFLEALRFEKHSLYILNYNTAASYAFQNNLPSAIEAIENIDQQIAYIYDEVVTQRKGKLFITSSYPLLENLYTHSSHRHFIENYNPVFFIAADPVHMNQQLELALTELSDIVPFVIKNMAHHSSFI